MPITGNLSSNYIIQQALNISTGTQGIGYHESNVNAPNEEIRLYDYLQITRHLVHFLHKFGED